MISEFGSSKERSKPTTEAQRGTAATKNLKPLKHRGKEEAEEKKEEPQTINHTFAKAQCRLRPQRGTRRKSKENLRGKTRFSRLVIRRN
jgi:hypothetical protein